MLAIFADILGYEAPHDERKECAEDNLRLSPLLKREGASDVRGNAPALVGNPAAVVAHGLNCEQNSSCRNHMRLQCSQYMQS